MVIWWYGLIWYVLRSPLRPLARPCIFDASISCAQNPISPEDLIERTGFFINPHVSLGLFHTIPGMTGDYQTWTFKKVIDSLSELMNKGIAFAFTATQTCCRLPQAIANTYHEEQRIFLFSTLNHKFGKPANPHQVLSKINSFPEDLRGVGHSRIWVPMICLEQILHITCVWCIAIVGCSAGTVCHCVCVWIEGFASLAMPRLQHILQSMIIISILARIEYN